MEKMVSICIPTYNGAKFLAEAMDSAIAQTYKNLEIIVSDDASKDDTLKIIASYKEKTDIPIIIYDHKPSGIGANWNNCIKKANGEYIKFLFQDDILYLDCIEKMVTLFSEHTNLGLVACKRDFIIENPSEVINDWIKNYSNLQQQFEEDTAITYLDKSFFKRQDFISPPLNNKIGEPPTVLFKKSTIESIGYFDESLQQILDYVFYYRLLKKYSIAIINEPLVAFRIHNSQATNVNRNRKINDYKLYDKILYNEFYKLLHPSQQKRLTAKFSIFTKIKKIIKRVYKRVER